MLNRDNGHERIATVRTEMQEVMERGAGIYRTGDDLVKAVDAMHELQDRSRSIRLADHSRTFSTELLAALELEFMLDVAACILYSALLRQESRGAHQRLDFPERDDDMVPGAFADPPQP